MDNKITFEYKDESEDKKVITAMIDGKVAGKVSYILSEENTYILDSTNVRKEFGGMGVGTELIKQVVEEAIKNNVLIIPQCPFAKAVFDKNPDYKKIEA